MAAAKKRLSRVKGKELLLHKAHLSKWLLTLKSKKICNYCYFGKRNQKEGSFFSSAHPFLHLLSFLNSSFVIHFCCLISFFLLILSPVITVAAASIVETTCYFQGGASPNLPAHYHTSCSHAYIQIK